MTGELKRDHRAFLEACATISTGRLREMEHYLHGEDRCHRCGKWFVVTEELEAACDDGDFRCLDCIEGSAP